MMKRLYLTDIDGTLARAGYDLPEETAAMMRRIVQAGVPVAVATGRYVSKALPVIEQAGIVLPAIVLNGAMVFDPIEEKAVQTWPMDWEEALELITKMEETGANVRVIHHRPWEQRCVLYSNAPTPHSQSLSRRNSLGLLYDEQLVYPAIGKMLRQAGQQGEILYVGTSGEKDLVERAAAAATASCVLGFCHQSPHQIERWFLDVVSAQSGKGVAARWLRQACAAQTMVVFGDNENDRPLLKEGDVACTVPEAPPEVRAMAQVVLDSSVSCVPLYIMEQEGLTAQ